MPSAALPEPVEPRLLDARFSRRGFLVRSAGLSAALTLGGCAGAREETYAALLPDGERPAVLPLREYAVLRTLANRLVPGGPDHPGALELGVPARVDRELGFHPQRLRDDVRDALRLVEWWPLLTRFARFTTLDPEDRDAELTAMMQSRLAVRRSAFQGLKFLVLFFHYAQEPAWQGIGYDGPWVPRGPERTWS